MRQTRTGKENKNGRGNDRTEKKIVIREYNKGRKIKENNMKINMKVKGDKKETYKEKNV